MPYSGICAYTVTEYDSLRLADPRRREIDNLVVQAAIVGNGKLHSVLKTYREPI